MNRILTLGLAAVGTALLSQPVYADKHDGGGKGGGGGGKASAPHISAPRMSAPRSAPQHFAQQRSAPMPHFNNKAAPMAHANNFRAAPIARNQNIQNFRAAPTARVNPRTNFTPSVANNANVRAQRNVPSVAFGGTSVNNNVAAQNGRNFANTNRGNIAVPGNVSRDWDHRRAHEWNHHHFRWDNGGWVLFDSGYPYGYGYGYPSDYGYYNDYSEPAPAMMYDSSGSLAASVQAALDQQGYNAGPADGVIGPQTRDALSDFQYSNHLPVSGAIDDPTLRALGLR